jgi:glucose-1-phosphate cytidylyltransferase
MKTVILAGGLGTRLAEETQVKPKPMVEIGGKPMLWHLMNIYAAHGFSEFIVALGYKGECIKDYFLNFYARNNYLTVDLCRGETAVHHRQQPGW